MRIRQAYYKIKPLIPRGAQLFLRRTRASSIRKAAVGVWPIHPASAVPPEDWRGWPNGKRFALVLSHDVDSYWGHEKCGRLLELEHRLGFRSSFNFVPELYRVSDELRKRLKTAGFDVGVHGLNHDGKLFLSRSIFAQRMPRINHYINSWGAAGFHSPSMQRHFEWISELNIEYDCSTFDTDPFEPQPDGVETIFPFAVYNPKTGKRFIELPYTLPQDHCLFIILKENDIKIWKQKLDWIADKGGMAFINTHPDYMNFDGDIKGLEEYPVSRYSDFLNYLANRYDGRYWNALPREIARFWKESFSDNQHLKMIGRPMMNKKNSDLAKLHTSQLGSAGKIWIDLDNTPHVPFFKPIIRELKRRGYQIVVTARDAFQVCDLADALGLPYFRIGRHYGKNPIMKVLGLVWRSLQLLPFFLREKPQLALSHGSRSQVLLGNLMRVTTVLMTDYEHTKTIPLAKPKWKIVPSALCPDGLPLPIERILCYQGLKEDVYVTDFKPDPSIMSKLGMSETDMIVTIRPPATEAHYYNPESSILFRELMSRVVKTPNIRAILLPRNRAQEQAYRKEFPEWFEGNRTIVPPHAVDGLSLIWYSDLVVSAGGTMNREAAALGVPVYSIFHGEIGAVDKALEREGRLRIIGDPAAVHREILFSAREKGDFRNHIVRPALSEIIEHIEEIFHISYSTTIGDCS